MKAFAPSTALSYAVTAVSLIPELKEDPGTPPAILYLLKITVTFLPFSVCAVVPLKRHNKLQQPSNWFCDLKCV